MGKRNYDSEKAYDNIVNQNYTGDVKETGNNAGKIIDGNLDRADKRVNSIGTPEGWNDLVKQANEEVERINIAKVENQKILANLEKEQNLEDVVKQNESQEKWYSGITSFFDALDDRSELSDLWHNKEDGKWYKKNNSLFGTYDKDNLTEVPYDQVQKLIESQAQKMSKSGGYQTGIATKNVFDKAFEDGVWGTVYGIGSLITRGITGNWDDVNDSQIESLWNRTKYYASNLGTNATKYTVGLVLYDDETNKYVDTEQAKLNSELDSELVNIQKQGQVALEKRKEEEQKRRVTGEKNLIDKIYDWSEVEKDNDFIDQQTKLKATISERAMEIEGRKKKSFSDVEDTTINNGTFKYIDDVKGINMELPLEKTGGADGSSKSIWDMKKLVIDASGKPVLDDNEQPVYEDKYSLTDKIVNSNWNVLGDVYYLQDDLAQGVGTAVGFVAGGKGTNMALSKVGQGLGKVGTAVNNSLGLESKALNYTNKILNAGNKITAPLGKTVGGTIDKTAFAKNINIINDKVSKAVMTATQSYLMSNTESEQIGRQVQKTILDEQIDKYAKIDLEEIAKELTSKGKFTSDSGLFLEAQMQAETRRKEWSNENPELFNEILLQAQLGKEQARGINNINFINNITSAGLFVKGKSFSRNLLSNPISGKSLAKGAWTLSREMVQEGLIEEGLINGFAQKAGEETGRMKFYNVSDFFKNDVASGEFAENVFAGALLGGLQTAGTKVVNLRSEYKQFKEQQKVAKELSKIGSLNNKENIKKVIEYSLDKANNEAVAQRINDLVSEGKEAETSSLADTLLLNKSVQAATSGTTEVLNDSLNKLMVSEDLNAEDKVELQKAIAFNNFIADNYDAHIRFENKTDIIANRGNKELLEGYKQELINSIPGLEKSYQDNINRQIRQGITAEGLQFNTADEYNEEFEKRKNSTKLGKDNRTFVELDNAQKQIDEIQSIQDELDNNYDYITSDKGVKEYRQKMKDIRKANITKNVNKDNVNEIKEELKNNDDLTPETNSNINQKVEEKVVADNVEVVKPTAPKTEEFVAPDKEQVVKNDTAKVPDVVKEKAKQFTSISEEPLFDDAPQEKKPTGENLGDPSMDRRSNEADNNDSFNLQPIDLNENSPSQNSLVNNYTRVMNDLNNGINTDFGTNLSAKEMFGLFASQVGFDVAEKHFNFFKKAFEKTGIQDDTINWDNLYSKYFDKMKSFSFNDTAVNNQAPVSVEEVREQDEQTNSIIQEDTKPIGYNSDNTPIKYNGRKIAVAVNKIPFLGIKYRAVYNELDGSVTYVNDEEGELNTEGMTNLNVVLNPDLLVTGRKFELVISPDWETKTVSEWRTNEVEVLVQDTMTMREWMQKNNVEIGSQEFIDKVPMDMIVDGSNIGSGVHDVSWWNSRNTADFIGATINDEVISPEQAKQRQDKLITEGRELTRNIRRNVYEGNTEMVITDREEGHTLSSPDGTLTSISQANPQAELGIFSPQGFITGKDDNGNEYSRLNIVNMNSITDNGHIFMISRIGTQFKDNKNIPTYVAHKVHTNHNQEALTELSKSRQRMYVASDILNRLGKYSVPTETQTSWAEGVRDQVKSMTGISIDNISMEGTDVKYIGLGKLKQLYPLPAKNGSGLMLLPQLANIKNQKLPIVNSNGTVTNYKSEAGEGYRAMLMDNLHTQKKFHTIQDQEGNDMQVLDIQPRIKFDLVNKEQDIVRKEKQEEARRAKETVKAPIINSNQSQIDEINQRRKEEFLTSDNTLLESTVPIIEDYLNNPNTKYATSEGGNRINDWVVVLREGMSNIIGTTIRYNKAELRELRILDQKLKSGIISKKEMYEKEKELRKRVISRGLEENEKVKDVSELNTIDKINAKYDAEIESLNNNEIVSDEQYNDFIDNGNVQQEVLEVIADKIKVNENLTEREFAIFNDKTSEVNELLKDETPITEITNGQRKRVVEYLFHKILGGIDITSDFTTQDILNDIRNSFDNHLNDIKGTREYQYLVDNKDAILGLNEFSNDITTVKYELESFLNQEFLNEEGIDDETQLNDEGQFEKNNNKASFENDVRTSLSTKLKMFFAGIPKDSSKVISEEFGGLESFYGLDEVLGGLQDMLVNVSNTPLSFKNKIENQIAKNPEEFGFLQNVLDKFDNAPIEVQKEILYRLNQTKNEMSFVMYSKSKNGNYTLMTYDANSKNPNIKTKLEWQENFKQSPLINNNGDNYSLKLDKANNLLAQFNNWKGKYENVSNKEYVEWLSNFGILVSEKTIQDYKDGLVEGNTNFPGIFAINGGGIFGKLINNLKTAIEKQTNNENIVFKYKNENKQTKDGFNLLTNDNGNFLKTMIDVQVNNTFNLASSMYIGGKTINSFSQPNFTTEQLRKLKDETNPLTKNLEATAFAQNSLLLKLIKNKKIKNALGIGYVSLESLKQQGQKVYQPSEIVDLSSQDYDLLLQGFFENEGAYFKNQELEDTGISLRETKMTFPTLSDSSQMFIFNTVGLDLKKGNFTFVDGKVKINAEVMDILYSQLVKPDLDRMEAYLKSIRNTNVQGLDLGAQLFTMIPSLNTMKIDIDGNQVKLLTLVHQAINTGNNLEDVLGPYRTQINQKLQSVIDNSAESKLRIEGDKLAGSWVNNGFVVSGQTLESPITTSFLDTKYLNSRGTTSRLEATQIAAYDFTINYYINQANIQMLFSGDIANYVQDKQGSKFNLNADGKPDVTKPKVSVNENENQIDKEQEVYTNIIKATSVNMSKRLKELISPGNRLADSKGEKYIQIMVNDVEEASNTLEALVKMWYPELYAENRNDIKKLKELEQKIRKENKEGKSAKVSETEYNNIKKSLQAKFPDIADYFKITATDAQEYTTWKEHIDVLLNQGRIQQALYNSLFDKLDAQSKFGVNEANKLSKEEKKVIFQPLKPLHAGMYFEDLRSADGEVTSKIQRYVYVKTSSFPLLPQMTEGLELDNMRKNIETLENKTGKKVRVSYQSGNKVGAVKSAINVSELYSDYTGDLENKILDSSALLDRENFSIQQDKPFKTDKNIKANKRDEINRGTQFEKILLGNGINMITEKIFPNKFDTSLLESLGITDKDGNISGKDLYAIYTNLYQREQSILRNQLYSSLGLDSSGEWVNNIETLEQIKNALNKRLSNQQDKEILELSYIVTEEDADGNIVNKYYTEAEMKEKGLKPTRAEFNIPIWMSPNSRKFESVLNSIVNNKLVNLKLPGFSSPVASQEGFTFKEDYDKTGVIFTEKFDGELKATHNSDGSLKTAQILVASKFRVKKRNEDTGKYIDELLDLTQYTKKLEDGRTVLDMDKVSPDLLEMFSFRIPTSAHQSGALIEIVGFLPHGSGDLMIVPKDHTTQLGEDYDIDTRYVYSQNYRIDSKNNVRKIDAEYIQRRVQMLDDNLASELETERQIDEILNLFDSIKNDEEIQNIFSNDKTSREQKVDLLKDKLNHMLIENQLVDVYKSIFSSTNTKIQKMIGATLSTQFAEDTAEAIDRKLNSAIDDSNFSIFDDRHQKSILKLGASGKLGIGVHSNWVVLNSLFQQMENKPKLINGFNQKTGKAIPFEMKIGNFTSYGNLGQNTALQPDRKISGFVPRLLSVVNMESQNSSTDNQKLQIMGRRNENKYTINVFALMSNLGFDKDVVDGQELSLPSLFISQPIIRRYVELKEQYDSIMSEYQEDVDDKITGLLAKEFSEGVELVPTKKGLRMDFDQMKRVEINELTAQKLYNSLLQGNNAQQWAVFEKFMDLSVHAKNINKVQQLANIDSDGLGISFFNTINKKDALLLNMTAENLNIEGIEQLFGEQQFVSNNDEEAQQDLLNEGYIKVETQDDYSVFVKPNSPLSSKLTSAIASGYNLWKNVLPFENQFIDEQIVDVINITGKDPDTKKGLELKYKVVSEMKDFIYSYSNLGIYDAPVNEERQKLFFDTEENISLASYLNTLKKDGNKLFNEPFFKDLEFVINKVSSPSLIKYTTNDRTNFNKNSVYNTFNVLNDSTESLPDYNGDNNYTFEKLAKDLTKYSLLSNQENGAIGFRTYIPMNILNKYKVTDNLRRHSGVGKNSSHNLLLNGNFKGLMNVIGAYKINENNTIDINQGNPNDIQKLVDIINTKYEDSTLVYDTNNNVIVVNDTDLDKFKSVFIRQFFQHNAEEAKKFNWNKKKEWMKESNSAILEQVEWFVPKKELPEYISIRDSKNSKFLLFEKDINGVYRKIDNLGGFGYNEYSPFINNQESKIITVQPIENTVELVSPLTVNGVATPLLQNMIDKNSKFKDIAELILPFVDEVKVVQKDLQGMANGIYVTKGEGKTVPSEVGELERGTVYISEELVNQGESEKLNYAIMEEIVHGITVDEVDKYVDTRNTYYNEQGELNIEYKQDEVPAHIVKLVALFKQGSKHILDKYTTDGNIEEAIKSLNEQRAIWNRDVDSEFYSADAPANNELRVDTYRTLNLGEFIAGVMLSDKFRAEMDKVPYRSTGKSILSNFAEVIGRIINSLSPGAVKGSVTGHTIDAVMALLTYSDTEVKPVKQSKFGQTQADISAKELLSSPDSNNVNLGDPSNDSTDNSVSLQPIGLNEITKIKTC